MSPSSDARLVAIKDWLADQSQFQFKIDALVAASSDASFRRYFRLPSATHGTLIVMDAPPDKEDCRPFIRIAAALTAAGLSAPHVLASNLALGALVLTDLGQTTYLQAFAETTAAATDRLMRDAVEALIKLQLGVDASTLPDYDGALLLREMSLFTDWFVIRHCGHTPDAGETAMLQNLFGALAEAALRQPQVAVHRDYHSRNLMRLDTGAPANPGILDFQDAVRGAATYDLVSLLRDAYIVWPEEQALDWAIRYWEGARRAGIALSADFGDFWRDFEWMGLQRHLKVLGIFCRLSYRDGKHGYLDDLPRVMGYVRAVASRYAMAKPLLRFLDRITRLETHTGYTF